MVTELISNLFLSTAAEVVDSAAMSMSGDNCAMLEFFVTSADSLTGAGVTFELQGSNDGINWTSSLFSGSPNSLSTASGTTAPSFGVAHAPLASGVVPYEKVRVRVTNGSSGTALVSARVTTYRQG